MKRITLAAITISLCSTVVSHAVAASQYLYVPLIADSSSLPGYTGVMPLQSTTIVPNGYSVIKDVDPASPAIQNAVIVGKNLSTTTLLLYNGAPTAAPDATIPFLGTLASGYQFLNGPPVSEHDTFNTTTPDLMYLILPGVTTPSTTPGFSNVIAIQSLTFNAGGGTFTVVKPIDSASPKIFQDVVAGTLLPTATVLFYNAATPGAFPDAEVDFHAVVIASDQTISNNTALEQDTFSFQTLSQPTPEPVSIGAIGFAAVGLLRRRKSR